MNPCPPKYITRWLSRLCKPELWESIEGDLYELFLLETERKGLAKARRNYLWNALAFLRYQRLQKKSNSKTQYNMSLLKNYLKISWRDLRRNSTFSTINLVGLVSGMTIFLLILQYVLFETSFDTFHSDSDRTYRVINDRYQNGASVQKGMITYPAVGPLLKADIPEIEAFTRMTYNTRSFMEFEGEARLIDQLLFADEHFLTFFDFPLLMGDEQTALDAPYEIVITESYARRLSRDDDPSALIGQTMIMYGAPIIVTAIAKDVPTNSHLQFDVLISYKSFIAAAGENADNSMTWSDFYHYVKLQDGVTSAMIADKLDDFGKRHFKEGEVSGAVETFGLQPLLEVRMDDTLEYEIGNVTDGRVVWLMLTIGIFILVIAWINYINLSTSRAIQRAKEVGIRKSIGGNRDQLVSQFIAETAMINAIALALSVLFVFLLQPYFNNLTGLQLNLSILTTTTIFNLPAWLFLMLSLILSVLAVAIYPSVLTSRFTTQEMLKGSFSTKGEIVWLRKALVIFQFSIAVILISGVMAVNDQINYMLNKDLGINIEKSLMVYGPTTLNYDSTLVTGIDSYKNNLAALSGVDKVTATTRPAGNRMGRAFQIRSLENPELDNLTSNIINADHAYADVFGLDILAGRDLGIHDHNSDGDLVNTLLINESAVKLLGFLTPDDAVNTRLNFFGHDWTIVGVINDFHQMSLHQKIEPLFVLPYYSSQQSFALKLSGNPDQILPAIREVFLEHYPGNHFDYYFLKDRFQSNYQAEFRLAEISKVFTVLSILVATLGLYGLVMITMMRKTKEISIRKVLGASLQQLLFTLNRDFILLIGIAAVLGSGIAYVGLEKWKEGFAYSTDMELSTLAIASIALLVICLITVGFHVGKVIRNNPSDSLRNE